MLECGRGVLRVNASTFADTVVIFPRAFTAPPLITLSPLDNTIGGTPFILDYSGPVTETSFTARFRSLPGASSSGNALFYWMAVGR